MITNLKSLYAMSGESKPDEPYNGVEYVINDGYGNIIIKRYCVNDSGYNPLYGMSNATIVKVNLM